MFRQKASVATIAIFSILASTCALAQRPKKVADPEPLGLTTKDGVNLHCMYYPGGVIEKITRKGKKKQSEFSTVPAKEIVPVILVHGYGEKGNVYDALATYLQRQGHAVVVPDLRGHGRSTSWSRGGERELRFDRMRAAELASSVNDIEAVKKFLLKKNNKGELNIEMLCIVGAEMGAIIALNYTALDWNRQQLPAFKQGRDVKALVLLSPTMSFKGMSANPALKHPFVPRLSIMTIVGEGDRSGFRECQQIQKRLERFHKEPPPAEIVQKKSLFNIRKPVNLKGTDLVHGRVQAGLKTHRDIAQFIVLRLVNKKSLLAWQERKNPLQEPAE